MVRQALRQFFVTTPIFYVNGAPHIGHAYTSTVADVIARWKRLCGYSVHFLTGTDEHGKKVQLSAEKVGISPHDFCDSNSLKFKNYFKAANIDYTRFIRTTEPAHAECVSSVWKQLEASGHIYLGEHTGWYCTSDEAFVPDSQVRNGRSLESGHPVERISEENFKFKLSAFSDDLLSFYKENPDWIVPRSKYNEVIRAVEGGLPDLSVSRLRAQQPWGISVPGNDEHTIYVWLDALMNYMTGRPASVDGVSPDWPPNVQVMGKDILKFHAIYWPAFLLALKQPLPQQLLVHAHWTVDGTKMSKSLGNVIDPMDLIQATSSEHLRYFLLKEGALDVDGDFSMDRYIAATNADLADKWGNLLSRVISHKMSPTQQIGWVRKDSWPSELQQALSTLPPRIVQAYDDHDFSAVIEQCLQLLRLANGSFSQQQPWLLYKQGQDIQASDCVGVCADVLRVVATLMQPIVPELSQTTLSALGLPEHLRSISTALGGLTAQQAAECLPLQRNVRLVNKY